MTKIVRYCNLGTRDYRSTHELQLRLHERIATGASSAIWLFVEHEPVITLGRNASGSNVLLSRDALSERGVDVVEIERGGDVTYHGPGQLVVYPLMKLERFREVLPLVRSLEAAVIDACRAFDITGERWSEHSGVWVGTNQICAIGLAIRKMASMHGIALNVHTELTYNQLINPCGLPDRGITSISQEVGRAITLEEAQKALLPAIGREFDVIFESVDPMLLHLEAAQ